MNSFLRLLSAATIFACSVASCAGDEFSAGNGTTTGGDTTGSAGNAGTDVGTAGAAGGGTAGVIGSGGANSAGGNGAGGANAGGGVIGTGGVAGAGGHAGGNAGSGGTGVVDAGRDAGQCPATIPASTSSCTSEGLSCTYGECCPSYATCISGKWQIAIPKCAVPACPVMAPVNGTSCTCFAGLSCQYDKCSQTQQITDAKCNANNVWGVQTYGCENACGAEDCVAGQICISKGGVKHCVTSPCLPNPLACACASGLCAPAGCSVNSANLTCQ